MEPFPAILYGGLIPFVVSLVILFIAWRPWIGSTDRGRWGGPVAIAAALAAGYLLMPTFSRLRFPPADSTQWLVVGTWGLGVLGLALSVRKWLIAVRIIVTLLGVAGLMSAILYRQMQNTWTTQESVIWVGGLTLAAGAWTLLLSFLASRSRSFLFPLGLTLVFAAASAMLLMKDSVTLGQLAGIITSAMAAFIIVSLGAKSGTISLPTLLVAVPALSAAMMRSHLVGGSHPFGWVDAALLVGASVLIGVIDLPGIRTWKTWKKLVILLVLLAVPLSLLLVPTTRQFLKDMREAGELGY